LSIDLYAYSDIFCNGTNYRFIKYKK